MRFDLPPNQPNLSPTAHRPTLRAEGNLSYLDFISIVGQLWEQGHPDIPFIPTQGKNFAKTPAIVYGLEVRTTHTAEPKFKFREQINDGDDSYIIAAQRFDNIVTFTAVTTNDPTQCEVLIEAFEDFMIEHTPIFKKLGLSEIVYSRRFADREDTRESEDLCLRRVAYKVTIEKIRQLSINKLAQIEANVRVYLKKTGTNFIVYSGDNFLTMTHHDFEVGDQVVVLNPLYADFGSLPGGLYPGAVYNIATVSGSTVTLTTVSGEAVTLTSEGSGRLVKAKLYDPNVEIDIVDDHQGEKATPTY